MNIEHRTSNIQHPNVGSLPSAETWVFDVGCWMFDVFQKLAVSETGAPEE
jgi:hypothetical protein